MKDYKKPRYTLSIIAQFRKHAFKEAFRKHLNHLIDEIETEVKDNLVSTVDLDEQEFLQGYLKGKI